MATLKFKMKNKLKQLAGWKTKLWINSSSRRTQLLTLMLQGNIKKSPWQKPVMHIEILDWACESVLQEVGIWGLAMCMYFK
jgi:hypothetical protein